jgi:hypothetical protein
LDAPAFLGMVLVFCGFCVKIQASLFNECHNEGKNGVMDDEEKDTCDFTDHFNGCSSRCLWFALPGPD